ncbi:MAG: DUF3667 domain-containing protein [Alistipes sp.]|nr:DUF3667 domain-containing protein [Alistipes sp.]
MRDTDFRDDMPAETGEEAAGSAADGVKGADACGAQRAGGDGRSGADDGGKESGRGLFARAYARLRRDAMRRRRDLNRRLEYERVRRIRRKSVPAYTHCKNCGERLAGMYCHRCGQYALDIEQPFWKYVKQYFENVYQFDSKVWQTLWLLVRRPGFLTQEFNAGKINSYVHPLRLFMFLSVLFFTFIFFFAPDASTVYGNPEEDSAEAMAALAENMRDSTARELMLGLSDNDGMGRRKQVWVVSAREELADLGSLVTIHDEPGRDTLLVEAPALLVESKILVSMPGDTIYWSCNDANCPPEARRTSESERLKNEMMYQGMLGWLSKWLPLVVLLLIPVFALLLQWTFRRARMLYMGHFVMALNVHSVLLLLITLAIVAGVWCGVPDKYAFWVPAALFQLYMIAAFHRLYGYGWVRTTVKSLFMYAVYLLVVFGVMMALVVLGAISVGAFSNM